MSLVFSLNACLALQYGYNNKAQFACYTHTVKYETSRAWLEHDPRTTHARPAHGISMPWHTTTMIFCTCEPKRELRIIIPKFAINHFLAMGVLIPLSWVSLNHDWVTFRFYKFCCLHAVSKSLVIVILPWLGLAKIQTTARPNSHRITTKRT